MLRNDTLFKRFEIFVAAATIAAHASGARASDSGFRQRDVRFLIELFTNWVESSLSGGEISLKNTQILRFLEGLVQEGYAKKLSRQKQPIYRLTRLGLLELLIRLANRPSGGRPEHFIFLYYFLRNYSPRIVELIKNEGKQFPTAMRMEIEALLDYKRLLRDEILSTEKELRKLDERINDSLKSGRLASKLFLSGSSISEIVLELESLYPYELNSQKPLSELIGGIPADIGKWELEVGSLHRAQQIWQPIRTLRKSYLDSLKQLD